MAQRHEPDSIVRGTLADLRGLIQSCTPEHQPSEALLKGFLEVYRELADREGAGSFAAQLAALDAKIREVSSSLAMSKAARRAG